jgi:hypothetical protein
MKFIEFLRQIVRGTLIVLSTLLAVYTLLLFSTFFIDPGSVITRFLNMNLFGATDIQGLNFEFAASRELVVFPVDLPHDSIGLVVVHRETGKSRIIQQRSATLSYPRFSSDGVRLLFVRKEAEKKTRDLLTCQVDVWKCRVLWRTENSIVSPVEIEKEVVVLSSSPPWVRSDGQVRYIKDAIYLARPGSAPIRLSDFVFNTIYSLDVMGEQLLISAEDYAASAKRTPLIAEPRSPSAPADSNIFVLEFDRTRLRIERPSEILQPRYLLDAGRSAMPSASADVRLVAFLNRRATSAGPQGFHLVIAERDGEIKKQVVASGFGFSQPAFVGRTVLAKEMTEKEWIIRAFDVDADTESIVARFDLSAKFLKLESIAISISE